MTTLREALAVGAADVVALVGAGGKTTAMFRIARELAEAGERPVVTTTTKILVPERDGRLRLVVEAGRAELLRTIAATVDSAIPVAAVATTDDGKLAGIPPGWVADLAALPGVTHVLVEADGAARHPIKAPREGEPVIPSAATLVVGVVGAEAIGARLDSVAHRPDELAALTGLARHDILEPRAISHVLIDGRGVMRGTPAAARTAILVNKTDDGPRLVAARSLARELLAGGATRVVIASLEGRGIVEVVRP